MLPSLVPDVSPTLPPPRVLNSWKEIAQYLGRGVRTVQRWEQFLGLPVRRPHGRSRSAVIAIPEELDAWLRKAHRNGESGLPSPSRHPAAGTQSADHLLEGREKLHGLTESIRQRVSMLNNRTAAVANEIERSLRLCKQLPRRTRNT